MSVNIYGVRLSGLANKDRWQQINGKSQYLQYCAPLQLKLSLLNFLKNHSQMSLSDPGREEQFMMDQESGLTIHLSWNEESETSFNV